jgi:hypothetical protein
VGPHHINGPARLKASESTQTSKAWVRASGCQFESIKTCTAFWSVIQQHLTDQLAINFPSPGHSKTQNACCWEGPFRLLNHPRSHKLFFLSFPGLHTYLPTYLPTCRWVSQGKKLNTSSSLYTQSSPMFTGFMGIRSRMRRTLAMRFNGIGPMRVKPMALGFHWNKGPCETDQSNHGPHASMICLAPGPYSSEARHSLGLYPKFNSCLRSHEIRPCLGHVL